MKKIIICGSITAAEEILKIRDELKERGFEVEIPEGVKSIELRGRTEISDTEKAEDKIKHDLIRGYFEKIKDYDIALVVNPEKRGVSNYIGGNTFIEMAFAHVLNKQLYVFYDIPELPYTSEILAMQPIILGGDLEKINQ